MIKRDNYLDKYRMLLTGDLDRAGLIGVTLLVCVLQFPLNSFYKSTPVVIYQKGHMLSISFENEQVFNEFRKLNKVYEDDIVAPALKIEELRSVAPAYILNA